MNTLLLNLKFVKMKKLLLLLFAMIAYISSFAAGHTVSVTSYNHVYCYGGSNGSITVSVSGGVGPFTYDCSGMSFAGPTITGLAAGTYSITVTDQSDMSTASVNFTINQSPQMVISLAPYAVVCNGVCVTLSPSVSGGTPGYTFSWAPMAGLSSPVISSPTACPTTTTTYTITATDANGCVVTATTTVYVSTVAVAVSGTNVSSCGACDGTATATVTGGSGPFTYLWSPGGPTTAVYSMACVGIYAVTVTDMNGCSATNTVTISGPSINANFTMIPDSANAYSFTPFNTTAGTGMSYSWNFGDGTSSTMASPPAHTYTSVGTYTVCLTASSALCTNTRCETVNVTGTASPCMALFNIATDTNAVNPNAFTVYNLSYGSSLSYSWDFGDGNTSALQNPTHVYASNGNYLLCLTVNNGAGCSQTYCDSLMGADSLSRTFDPLTITVLEGPGNSTPTGFVDQSLNYNVNVAPNPFTEETTFIISSSVSNGLYSFELIDVLGKKVMETKNITSNQFMISRNNLENGVYFYKIYNAETLVGIGKLVVK